MTVMDVDCRLYIFLLLAIVWLLVLLCYPLFPIKKKAEQQIKVPPKIKTSPPPSQLKQPQPKITIQLYNDLFTIFKEAIKYIATIKEIDLLIKQEAELPATFMQNDKIASEYVSYDNLLIWRESYVRQLNIYFRFLVDTYQSIKILFTRALTTRVC